MSRFLSETIHAIREVIVKILNNNNIVNRREKKRIFLMKCVRCVVNSDEILS